MNKIRLGEIATFKTGPFGTQFKASEYTSFGIPVINVKNIGNGDIIEDNLDYISELTCDRLSAHLLEERDIVFGRKGSVDRHAYISKEYEGWIQGSDCIRVRCIPEVNARYVSHQLKLKNIKKQINCSAVGSTMASLNPEILKNIELVMPTTEIQNRIEKLLSIFEKKIQLNKKINTELESMAKIIYDYWFTQFDFPDENGKPYRLSGGEMVYNELLKKEIPKGWKANKIKDILEVVTGKEDANFSTPNGKYKFFTCSQKPLNCDKYAFDGHAVLIAGNGDFNVKHYSGKFNAYQRTYVLIPEDTKYHAILYLVCNSLINIFRNGSNGSIVKFITKGDVENIHLIIPDTDLYFEELNKLIYMIELNQRENQQLARLRDWLLPLLMNGQATIIE